MLFLGKKTEDEILAEFLDNLQYHFSLLKSEKEQENNQINLEEFLTFLIIFLLELKMMIILKM